MRNMWDWLFPQPQWILTPYAEERLKEINPIGYQQLKSDFQNLKTEAKQGYLDAINPFKALSTPAAIAGVIVIIAVIILLLRRR